MFSAVKIVVYSPLCFSSINKIIQVAGSEMVSALLSLKELLRQQVYIIIT